MLPHLASTVTVRKEHVLPLSCGSYIACDMEEDDPISKRSIFQFLLGTDTWQDLYKDFQRLQGEFLQVIDYRAWVTRQECEEICQGSVRGGGRQGAAQRRTKMGPSSWTHLSFPFQIQNQNPHHWVWSRVRQSAP